MNPAARIQTEADHGPAARERNHILASPGPTVTSSVTHRGSALNHTHLSASRWLDRDSGRIPFAPAPPVTARRAGVLGYSFAHERGARDRAAEGTDDVRPHAAHAASPAARSQPPSCCCADGGLARWSWSTPIPPWCSAQRSAASSDCTATRPARSCSGSPRGTAHRLLAGGGARDRAGRPVAGDRFGSRVTVGGSGIDIAPPRRRKKTPPSRGCVISRSVRFDMPVAGFLLRAASRFFSFRRFPFVTHSSDDPPAETVPSPLAIVRSVTHHTRTTR